MSRAKAVLEVGKVALVAGAIAFPVGAHVTEPPAHVSSSVDQAWRAQAREFWVTGERNISEIARRVGRPRSTVQRELASLGGQSEA
jgi:ActR/RegA family two-component response regulator